MNEMLSEEKTSVADSIARELNEKRADVNELSKCVGFLRDNPDGPFFFKYLDTVIDEGRAVVRSGRTLDYYRAVRDACRQYLWSYRDEPETMAWILGWAARLMRYYAVAGKLGRLVGRPKPVRRRAIHPAAASERRTGTVKWFDASKRFGFIKPDDGGDDLFVHISETPERRGLEEDQRVSFVTEVGAKGPRARDVQLE